MITPQRQKADGLLNIPVQIEDKRDLNRRFLSATPYGGLIVDVTTPVAEDELVKLLVTLGPNGQELILRGVVLWSRGEMGSECALGVGFLPSESMTRETLLSWSGVLPPEPAMNAHVAVTRIQKRYPTNLKVSYVPATSPVVEYTGNISATGIFVRSRQPLEVGRSMQFELYPPWDEEPIGLWGKVTWCEPRSGFGVHFTAAATTARERLDQLVQHVALHSDG